MKAAPRIVITGGEGRLARAAAPRLTDDGWDVHALSHTQLDVTDRSGALEVVRSLRPDVVLNLAAHTNVGACEADPEAAHQVNALGVRHIAEACDAVGARLCHLSSDYVFGGADTDRPYTETDEPAPLSVYGRTKRGGELELGPGSLLIRTAWLSGHHPPNVVHAVITQAERGDDELVFVDDQRGSPTNADDLIAALIAMLRNDLTGVFHVTNQGTASWYEIARVVLAAAGHDPERVRPAASAEVEPRLAGLRPRYSVLDGSALRATSIAPLPPWEDGFSRLARQIAGSAHGVRQGRD